MILRSYKSMTGASWLHAEVSDQRDYPPKALLFLAATLRQFISRVEDVGMRIAVLYTTVVFGVMIWWARAIMLVRRWGLRFCLSAFLAVGRNSAQIYVRFERHCLPQDHIEVRRRSRGGGGLGPQSHSGNLEKPSGRFC